METVVMEGACKSEVVNTEGSDLMELPSSLAENEDILIEILSKLPVKYILKFLCLSKKWCAIIESSYFMKKHQKCVHRMNPNLGLLYRFEHEFFRQFRNEDMQFALLGKEEDALPGVLDLPKTLNDDLFGNYVTMVGSSNGLVCLYMVGGNVYNKVEKILVWNPSTRKHRELPPALYLEGEDTDQTFLGFGFVDNSTTTDYKVVKIRQRQTSPNMFCYLTQVFDQSENSWREIKDCIPSGDYDFPSHNISGCPKTCTLNGVVYGLATVRGEFSIVSFNLNDEVIKKTAVPSQLFLGFPFYRLYSWRKSLAFAAARRNYHAADQLFICDMGVWGMTQESPDDNGQCISSTTSSNWTKLFTISNQDWAIFENPIFPFGVWNDEFVYLRVNSTTRDKFQCAYDPASKIERNIYKLTRDRYNKCNGEVIDYPAESLFPVNLVDQSCA